MLKALSILCLVGVLVGCATDADMEAYYREQCLFDRITFEKIEPGSPTYEYCMELYRSGIGDDYDMFDSGTGMFAD